MTVFRWFFWLIPSKVLKILLMTDILQGYKDWANQQCRIGKHDEVISFNKVSKTRIVKCNRCLKKVK